MRTLRLILILGLGLFVLYQKYSPTHQASASGSPSASIQSDANAVSDESIPPKALEVLKIVRDTGQPPDGYVGGRVFQNREGRLPSDGDYREFDVDPHHGGRNAERIIVEWTTKKAWYTGDHYQTFIPLP